MIRAVNVFDFEAIARERMTPSSFDYYAGGAEDEVTLSENRDAFRRIALLPRVLVGADRVQTAVEVLGVSLACPVGLAPTALNKLAHADGELAAARAAGKAGTLMCCSTASSTSLEDVAAAAGGPLWFQLYVYRDREVTRDLVRRAELARCKAIVLTVDTPRLGRRERDARSGFSLPPDVSISNLERYGTPEALRWAQTSSFTEYVHKLFDPTLTWESVAWLKSITSLPLLIKGILSADDAALAIDHGASGIVVSNHGGRQLDGAMATIDALPAITARVAGRVPVFLDGGIRRGTDVFKALALGARAVFIGRAYLWGLAADGEAGVTRVLEMLRAELELTMALSGCQTVAAITPAHVSLR
ncbi:MAG TPA: alpha-hydroxy acid oxidase [Vicinamibacterales bacterium]|nr:alpha-hydroxy acid oxidase [Vicinamibacterales bacterium]